MIKLKKKMNQDAEYQKISEEKRNGSTVESETSELRKPNGSSFVRLIKYSLKHKFLLIIGNLSLLITSLSMVTLPYLIGYVIITILVK